MTESCQLIHVMEGREKRREERRDFFRLAAAAAVTAPLALTLGGKPITAQTQVSDADILNFALQLEYLEAQFYVYAVSGAGLPSSILSGTGTRGNVIGGKQVPFKDPVVQQYAREIAVDERNHVEFLREALGGVAVAQPTIDISTAPFTAAARAAGLIGAGQTFDPYATDENFLLGAFIFEDVGVTAYKGAAPLINSKLFLEAAAGILAVEAYHASLVRTVLFNKGLQTPAAMLIEATEAISDARDTLDDPSTDKDQGIAIRQDGGVEVSNIVPLDQNGIAFSRTFGDVLNIVFLTQMAASQGGFFPNGVNGNIRTSTAP